MKLIKFGKYLSIIGLGVIAYFIYCFNINNATEITIYSSFMFYIVCVLFIIICVMYIFIIKKMNVILKENNNLKDKINDIIITVKHIKDDQVEIKDVQVEIENDMYSKLNFIEKMIVDLSKLELHDG